MLNYYNISGYYVLKPWSYSVWEGKWILHVFVAQRYLPGAIIKSGSTRRSNRWGSKMRISRCLSHKKCSNWRGTTSRVSPRRSLGSHRGQSDFEEHIAIRPTSETSMYPLNASSLPNVVIRALLTLTYPKLMATLRAHLATIPLVPRIALRRSLVRRAERKNGNRIFGACGMRTRRFTLPRIRNTNPWINTAKTRHLPWLRNSAPFSPHPPALPFEGTNRSLLRWQGQENSLGRPQPRWDPTKPRPHTWASTPTTQPHWWRG